MTDIPSGIDNPIDFNADKSRTFKPTAFIKDQETMNDLIASWRNYAIGEERRYSGPYRFRLDYSLDDPRNDPFLEEEFGRDPDFDYDRKASVDWRYTLVNQEIPRLFRESATRIHGVNFFDEIQQNLDKRKEEGNTAPLGILVTGSDIGFFNDELRTKFGNTINVAGTTVEVSRSSIRKQRFYELIKQGRLKAQIPPGLQEYLVASLKPTIDRRDRRWRSILQMENASPEFDMIIDTAGELLYSYDEKKPEIFELTFQACIQKLNPGGKLYIAELDPNTHKFVLNYCEEQGLGLEMHKYEDRHENLRTNYLITKPI